MPIAPNAISVSAWNTRSFETTAPTVDSDRCAAIGPSSSSSATRISPILPWVGSWPPVPAEADGEGEAPTAPGDGEALAAGLSLGSAEPEGLALAPGDADADADASGEPDGATDGTGVAAGAAGRSRVSLVRISIDRKSVV